MAASSSTSTSIPIGYSQAVRITVCHLDGRENQIRLHLDATVQELRNNVARIETIAPDSFQLVVDDHMIMDPKNLLSQYIKVLDPVVSLVKVEAARAHPVAEHSRCIACLKPFNFWRTELVCEKCWMEQVNAARHYDLDNL